MSDRRIARSCHLCLDFRVEEPQPQLETQCGTDGTITVRIVRAFWERAMVEHWFEAHPDYFKVIYPGAALVSDAILTAAVRAEAETERLLRAALVPLGGGHYLPVVTAA